MHLIEKRNNNKVIIVIIPVIDILHNHADKSLTFSKSNNPVSWGLELRQYRKKLLRRYLRHF